MTEEKFTWSPEDLDNFDPKTALSEPGQYPYTRGIHSEMYRSKIWTMRQYAGFGSAEETNERFRYLLANGQTGLSTAFDLPTQMGLDSDDPMALGEVGRTGVAIDTMEDMERLFDQIDLSKVSTSMTINATSSILLSMYRAVGMKQGVDAVKLRGTIQNDILKEYEARNTYIYPPAGSMRLITNIFEYCSKEMPLWNTISISGYHIREAGATAVQELAFTFANGCDYVKAAMNSGMDVDSFAPQLSFFFVAQMNFFEEIAKFRAARRIWARLMKEKFGAKNPKSWTLRFHVQTAGSSLTAQQPDNNIVRTALEALSAVLGGCQSLHTNSKDEALALPTPASALTALRTQQIIAYETGVTNVVDPLGGSYFIEELTNKIEREVEAYLRRIEEMGGATVAIESGFIQKEIQDSAYQDHVDIESGSRVVVGVNQFVDKEEEDIPLLRVDPKIEIRQKEKLARIKQSRDNVLVKQRLAELEEAARGTDNLIPYIIRAVECYASVGEISAAMKKAYGVFRPPITI
ncbi:MAG: methylmalonyl-CoA mutase [Candidatus Obscuribacterales bacterium]|nr:methylmalonyl-CoA mutase [Candidatus Obscuribacterales bacterium]